jgi:hypothetical protein
VSGPDFTEAISHYAYAHPRFCSGLRSDLGFRLVERTRPDLTTVEEYFYQDHGRAGRTSRRLVKDAGQVVNRSEASWQHVAGMIPGRIPGVFLGRLTAEERANEYATGPGALVRRIFSYDDAYGYDFVREIRTERPSGVLVDTRTPAPIPPTGPYLVGRDASRTLTNGAGVLLRDTTFEYVDLDGDPTGAKLGSQREFVAERGSAQGTWVDVLALRYDAYAT